MERTLCKVIILFFIISFNTMAQDNEKILDYFLSDKMNEWKVLIDNMENSNQLTLEKRLELVNYQYGYIAWCVGKEKYSNAKKYISKAEQHLDELEKNNYAKSWVYSYRSAFMGFKIAMSQWLAPFLGPKSIEYAENARKIDPNNWFAFVQLANIKFYTPSIVGGSKKEALNYYLKAKNLFESNDKNYQKNWNYLNLLVSIANAYIELGNYNTAKQYYEMALNTYPNFHWIKNELYPDLLKKIKDKNEK